jgi:hypothetical protein
MFGRNCIGTCSICGGRVSVPAAWMSVVPPVPTCESCGAVEAEHGPVIQMKPGPRYATTTGTDILIDGVPRFPEFRGSTQQ